MLGHSQGFQAFAVHRLFAVEDAVLLAETVDETVARRLNEKGSQMSGVSESPAGLAKPIQQISPYRLHDVNGIELRTESAR
jgi:malonyl CoA-acyl carrier protein transacylase